MRFIIGVVVGAAITSRTGEPLRAVAKHVVKITASSIFDWANDYLDGHNKSAVPAPIQGDDR